MCWVKPQLVPTHASPAILCWSLQALAAHHSDTRGFRVAYKRRAAPLQPPLRPNRDEMRDAAFCFCPSGFGAHHLMTCLCIEGLVRAQTSFDDMSMHEAGNTAGWLMLHPHLQVLVLPPGCMPAVAQRSLLQAVHADPSCRVWDAHHGGFGVWLHPSNCPGACGKCHAFCRAGCIPSVEVKWQQSAGHA